MWELTKTDQDKALARLAIGAFFYAMQSCEYLTVTGPRKTKIARVENIRFHLNGHEIPVTARNLARADTVSITFVEQKSDIKNQTITMYCTDDPLLCPVKAWAAVVQYILSFPGNDKNTPVNWCYLKFVKPTAGRKGRITFLKSDGMIRLCLLYTSPSPRD